MEVALEFLTKHFLVLSTAITVFVTAITFLFIASYLSVFDWNIIWVIEYTDIIKFVLITLAISSSIIPIIFNVMLRPKVFFNTMWGIVIILSFVAGAGIQLWADYHRGEYIALQFVSWCIAIAILFSIHKTIEEWPNKSISAISVVVFLFIIGVGIFGQTYGQSLKYLEYRNHDIFIKDAQTIHNATIIMMLSHHSIFQVGQTIIIVPSADIIRIVHATP